MTAKEKIIGLYNKADDKRLSAESEKIRQDFIKDYGPDVLKRLEGEALANRLFEGVTASSDTHTVERGLFSWLEHGGRNAKKGTFGYARDSAVQYGILLKDGKYVNHRQGKENVELNHEEVMAYADTVRDFICAACALIGDATLNTKEDYRQVDGQIKELCRKKQSPYWTGNGDIKQSLLKYLHIVFPDKVCEFYSPDYMQKIADELGLNTFEHHASKFYKNGQIMLYIKEIDAQGDSIRFARAVNPLVYKKKTTENKDSEFEIAASAAEEEQDEMSKTDACNVILYGPPGTGKTYNTVKRAVKIIEPGFDCEQDYKIVKAEYDKLVAAKKIAFTTFHQSYGYEEFIEGIKPVFNDDINHDIKYEITSGVFKEFCENAKKIKSANQEWPNLLFGTATVWKVSIDGAGWKKNTLHKYCLENGCIRIGGSDGEDIENSTDIILKRFANEMNIGDIVLSCYSGEEIDAIGVIKSDWEYLGSEDRLQYKRDVEWLYTWKYGLRYNIRAMNSGKRLMQPTVYRLNNISVDDVIRILNEQKDAITDNRKTEYDYDSEKYVFIIDEINRGNVSKIFGELITLIEPTKRLGADEAMTCKLPYSGKGFGVPKNVYILGTMNTADRSLVQLDAALRRRFEFEEMMPDYDIIKEKVGKLNGIDIADMLTAMNERICMLLDREHQIGHSYFLKLRKADGVSVAMFELAEIFRNSIIPLLQEYFYDDYDLIRKILGSNDFVIKKENSKYLWDFDSVKEVYEINSNKNVFADVRQYMRIYDKAVLADSIANE